jgi:hypothetical protein
VVCVRTPHPSRPGARRSTIWTVKARMGTVRQLGRQLKKGGIEIVTLESASDYWRIWFDRARSYALCVGSRNYPSITRRWVSIGR